jgi:DNA-3-methyladenine glycosylase II
MTLVIRDHPGWTSAGALSLRALGSGARRSAVAVNADDWHTYGSASAEPDVFDLVVFPPSVPSSLAHSLAAMGPVVRRPLQAAALAYLDHGGKWCELSPRRLVEELQTVPRIGPWTAGATAADFTHEWTLYPYGDLAVRKRAVAAAPDIDWPAKEDAFAARWRDITAGQLGPITVLTLAFGGHHGDSP